MSAGFATRRKAGAGEECQAAPEDRLLAPILWDPYRGGCVPLYHPGKGPLCSVVRKTAVREALLVVLRWGVTGVMDAAGWAEGEYGLGLG